MSGGFRVADYLTEVTRQSFDADGAEVTTRCPHGLDARVCSECVDQAVRIACLKAENAELEDIIFTLETKVWNLEAENAQLRADFRKLCASAAQPPDVPRETPEFPANALKWGQ